MLQDLISAAALATADAAAAAAAAAAATALALQELKALMIFSGQKRQLAQDIDDDGAAWQQAYLAPWSQFVLALIGKSMGALV